MAKGRKRRKSNSSGEGKGTEAVAVQAAAAPPPPPAAPPETEVAPPAPPRSSSIPTPINGTSLPQAVELTPTAPSFAPVPQPKLRVKGATDVGRKRDTNQDSFLVDDALRLFVVADGMGGHAGGGTASRIAVETLQAQIQKSRVERAEAYGPPGTLEESKLPEVLRDAVEAACFNIFHEARDNPSLAGMGTTATVLLLHGPHAFVAHVGDSRLYLVRGGEIHQVSEDHSLVNEQIKAGVLTPDEARHSQFKNVITRSVGFEEDVLVDLLGLGMEKGDTFIICCDGLSNLVEDREIAAMVRSEKLDDLPLRLIALANDRGGDDNITVVAVQVEEMPS